MFSFGRNFFVFDFERFCVDDHPHKTALTELIKLSMSRLNNHSNDSVVTHCIYRGIVTYNIAQQNIIHVLRCFCCNLFIGVIKW